VTSIRARLLASLPGLLALAALLMGAVTYRNVLAETETIFDYQLQQMALSLRDQGEIASAEAGTLADEQLDFVIQIWTIDGRTIYASRAHSSLPQRALLGLHTLIVDGNAWRTYGVATRERVIQVAQPVEIRQRLAARAAWRSVLPLLVMAPFAALAIWWLAAQNLAPLDRLARELRARDVRSLAPLPTTARAEATCGSTPTPPRQTGSSPPSRWMNRSRQREVNVDGALPRNHVRGWVGSACITTNGSIQPRCAAATRK
jgi:two-component system OmpR family sensor kinase/two-component system sensor histidine kinase QseC